jgi:hypothetical protein
MNIHKEELFLEPKTTQYGSHMVMTNVNKPTKCKYINIDTRFCEEYNYLNLANYNITIPERINNVKNISVLSAEIPVSFYNISANLGNNTFSVINLSTTTRTKITIPDNYYATNTALTTAINSVLSTKGITNISFTPNGNGTKITNSSSTITYSIEFHVGSDGTIDKNNFKCKLGWLLGFRLPTYTIAPTINQSSEQFSNLNGSQYLYLAVDEFKGIQNSVVTPMASSLINKNILARITMNSVAYTFGTVLPANRMNGLLMSDTRSYNGKVDLQKLNVSLLNEFGNPVCLNGNDFSFFLKVDYE